MSDAIINPAGWRQAPFIEQWLGHWAMREQEFHALAERLRGINLSVHLDSQAARDAARAGADELASYTRDSSGVALIEIRGRMQKQQASLGQSASTVALRRAVRAATADPEVGAILMVFDSPGGTVAGTGELAADIAAATKQKTVIGLAEDMCCSACYWAASQVTQLFSQPAAMVGSIGTYGVVYDQSAAAAQEGVKVHVIRAGDMKGVGTPGTEVTTQQLLEIQKEIDALNEVFLSGIACGRAGKLSADEVRELATGQVWIGQAAADAGLTDGVANIDQALAVARAASIKQLGKGKEGRKMANSGTAATYQELVASCVGATPEFICEQLKAGATVEQSQKDWMAHQQLQLEASRNETQAVRTKAAADLEAEKARAKLPGNDPLIEKTGGGDGMHASGNDARDQFNAAVEAKIKGGMSRPRAVSAVVREQPALHEALVPGITAQTKAKLAALGRG